jgi:hypothetical protein
MFLMSDKHPTIDSSRKAQTERNASKFATKDDAATLTIKAEGPSLKTMKVGSWTPSSKTQRSQRNRNARDLPQARS